MKQAITPIAVICLLILSCAGCDNGIDIPDIDAGSYEIQTPYIAIRAYPGGGGIFRFAMEPSEDFFGAIDLSLDAVPQLGAALTRRTLTLLAPVAELTLRPLPDAELGTYDIRVALTHAGQTRVQTFHVELLPWGSEGDEQALREREGFLRWLFDHYAPYAARPSAEWYGYRTYPQNLVVEHWTYLSEAWEIRMCYHVMIPPHDWSMILLRRRGEMPWRIAARRDTDSTRTFIPLEDYPGAAGY